MVRNPAECHVQTGRSRRDQPPRNFNRGRYRQNNLAATDFSLKQKNRAIPDAVFIQSFTVTAR
jgi:hypothetical protein